MGGTSVDRFGRNLSRCLIVPSSFAFKMHSVVADIPELPSLYLDLG